MASVKKTDIPEIASFMSEYWEHIKSVWMVENTDEYWDDAYQRTITLLKKYSNDPFCRMQILQFWDYLQSKHNNTLSAGKECILRKNGE